eukprot:gene28855-35835_t
MFPYHMHRSLSAVMAKEILQRANQPLSMAPGSVEKTPKRSSEASGSAASGSKRRQRDAAGKKDKKDKKKRKVEAACSTGEASTPVEPPSQSGSGRVPPGTAVGSSSSQIAGRPEQGELGRQPLPAHPAPAPSRTTSETEHKLAKKVRDEAQTMLGTPEFSLSDIPIYRLHRRMSDEATQPSIVDQLYRTIRYNRAANGEQCSHVPVTDILLQGAEQEQTIVSFEGPEQKDGRDRKKTDYFTDHAQLKPLLEITAEAIKLLGVRDFLPNEHGLSDCSPTSAQLVQILLLLSDLPRTVLVRSNLLASKQTTRVVREDRDSAPNIDIVSAPPGTGKTAVTVEAALALFRGERLPSIMKQSPSWSKSVRNLSPLGVHLVNHDLTELAPCNLLIFVAPDNVAGYWLKNLQHACGGDTERYTIYPKNAADCFTDQVMNHLVDKHTHTVEDYMRDEEQIPRKTLILRMTPAKFSEFLAKPPPIVWPLVVFDEFTAYCGSTGINATRPACKHLWGISATPTTIVHAFHGKSNKNPFKHLLRNDFLHAETKPIDPTRGPEHFRATPEQRQAMLDCNLRVSLINAFSPNVIRRTIENVAPMMPAGVDYFATHAP